MDDSAEAPHRRRPGRRRRAAVTALVRSALIAAGLVTVYCVLPLGRTRHERRRSCRPAGCCWAWRHGSSPAQAGLRRQGREPSDDFPSRPER
ncbi:hypothetical protein [Streptomyces sp. NPDC093598]|uniref:hypothetical protein n=1 Tax=Streptomyces sp. NPDC093598 TaxID=3366046 RepID=UPI00381BDAB3